MVFVRRLLSRKNTIYCGNLALPIQHSVVYNRTFMNKFAFLTGPARTDTEAESYGRLSAAKAKHCEPRGVSHGVNRYLSLLRDKSFSLTIKADDGSTLLETRVEYLHQAFQTLIDWSIDKVSQDACATISGPNGFYTNHRIKSSRDLAG